MQFDARAAKLLLPKQHITIDGHPGLRLEASMTRRTWTYRYRSPIDDRMRQVKIGYWPSMSLPAAIVAWEDLHKQRDSGVDVAAEKRTVRAEVIRKAEEQKTVLKGDVRTAQLTTLMRRVPRYFCLCYAISPSVLTIPVSTLAVHHL